MVVSTALIVFVTGALRVSGWATIPRAILVVPPALFWAATIAAALERLVPARRIVGPGWLAGLGAAAIAAAEWWALSPE